MNKVYLSGNLTKDPELKSTQSGKSYVRVGVAVKRTFSKDKDAVDFLNLMAWGKTAEFLAKWFNKGSRVLIEGCLQSSTYEKNGTKHTVVEVIIDQIFPDFLFGSSSIHDTREADDGCCHQPVIIPFIPSKIIIELFKHEILSIRHTPRILAFKFI